MRSARLTALSTIIIAALSVTTMAQEKHEPPRAFWADVETGSVPEAVWALPEAARPTEGRVMRLDLNSLAAVLAAAPMSRVDEATESLIGTRVDLSNTTIDIPMPDGGTERFRIVESPLMPEPMQALYPSIRTYIGQGVDRPAATLAMDLSPYGFHAQVLGPPPTRGVDRQRIDQLGTYFIDPVSRGDAEHHVAYWHGTLPGDGRFECTSPNEPTAPPQSPVGLRGPGPLNLRVLRIAIAATGEYTAFHSLPNPPDVNAGIAAVVTCLSRLNLVFMRDLGVQLILADNNNSIIYANAATDPFTPPVQNPPITTLTIASLQAQLPGVVAANIAAGAYDLGHVFHATGGTSYSGNSGGNGSVCGASAARGASTSSQPIGTYFWTTLVAHEVGHQLGGTHSFNGTRGTCGGGQYTASSAIEPGSGTTIMSYAGDCDGDNILTHNTTPAPGALPTGACLEMFNAYTIDQIGQVLAGTTCGFNVTTGNQRPFPPITSPGVWTIPANTPFRLNCSASDPDFGQQVTVSWEQYNLGAQRPLGPDTGAFEPLFRTFDPTLATDRYFPSLSTALGGPALLGENLPIFTRSMLFRAVSRDNFAQGGGTNWAHATVNVVQTPGNQSFSVSLPASGSQFCAGQILAVQWNPVGTADAPVNAPTVDITLSLDGGQTWPITLLAGAANSGQALVPVPAVNSNQARVKVEPPDNIFFAVSPGSFSIAAGPPSVAVEPNDVYTCQKFTPTTISLVQGPNPASIQWFRNGSAISNATGPSLTFPTLTSSNTGDYHATLTNACGQVSTRIVRVQVGVSVDPLVTPPSEVPACSSVTMSVRARGVGPLTTRWFRNAEPLSDNARFTGTGTSTLTISGARYDDEGTYVCRVTDTCETRDGSNIDLALPQPVWIEAPMNAVPQYPGSAEFWTSAFDEHRNVMILYGGATQTGQNSNSLWEYDGNTWVERQSGYPTVNSTGGQALYDGFYPPNPQACATVYNPDDRKVYLIGPYSWNYPLAIYTWDGSSWARPYYGPVNGDTGRTHAVYDRLNHRIVIVRSVGGSNNSELLLYNPVANTITGPIPMQPQVQAGSSDSALWYDQRRQRVIWYNNLNIFVQPTMWSLGADNQWTPLSFNPPRFAYSSRMVYDPVRFQALAMGGEVSSGNYYTGTVVWPGLTIKPWTLTMPPASDWMQVLSNGLPANPSGDSNSPPTNWTPAFWSGMVFDTRRRAMVAAGRAVSFSPLGYTWKTYERRYFDAPMFDTQPPASVTPVGQSISISAKGAGATSLSRTWTRNNVPLVDGPLAGSPGTIVSGAATSTLSLNGPAAAQPATYRLRLTNACGTVLSNAAVVGTPLVSDYDGDGTVTVEDLFDFLDAWFLSDLSADLDDDGTVTVVDLFDFLDAWFALS